MSGSASFQMLKKSWYAAPGYGFILSRTHGFAIRCCAETAGAASPAEPCPTLKLTTKNSGAIPVTIPVTIPNRTLSRFVPDATQKLTVSCFQHFRQSFLPRHIVAPQLPHACSIGDDALLELGTSCSLLRVRRVAITGFDRIPDESMLPG
jgi:hypothetical protein